MSPCSVCWWRPPPGRLPGGRRRVCPACRGLMKSKLHGRAVTKNVDRLCGSPFILISLRFREKPPSMMDEDFASVCIRNALGSSLPMATTSGLASPLYVATPFDHDYAKRKTLRRQQWQQQQQKQRQEEQQADGTVPVLDTASGVGLFACSALGQRKPIGESSDC